MGIGNRSKVAKDLLVFAGVTPCVDALKSSIGVAASSNMCSLHTKKYVGPVSHLICGSQAGGVFRIRELPGRRGIQHEGGSLSRSHSTGDVSVFAIEADGDLSW